MALEGLLGQPQPYYSRKPSNPSRLGISPPNPSLSLVKSEGSKGRIEKARVAKEPGCATARVLQITTRLGRHGSLSKLRLGLEGLEG